MKLFQQQIVYTQYGYATIKANSKKEAREKALNGDWFDFESVESDIELTQKEVEE